MVKAKAKKGFTAKSDKVPKKATITKKKPAPVPKDAMEALIQQAGASLSLSEIEKEKAKAKKAVKHQAKARRSVVRKKQNQRKAGKVRKQKRKGIN